MHFSAGPTVLSDKLLLSLAEELKQPLLQIGRRAELAALDPASDDLTAIQATADSALQLIDSFLLGVRLSGAGPPELMLEPVSVSSVLYDTAQNLSRLADFYGVKLELEIDGRYGPVTANRQALQGALTALGASLIAALPALDSPNLTLQLAAHRCRYGIVAGIYSDSPALTADSLRRGRQLLGRSRQPLPGVTPGSAAGVFVADALLKAMHLSLQTSRHHRLQGLGAVLTPNPQLRLV